MVLNGFVVGSDIFPVKMF